MATIISPIDEQKLLEKGARYDIKALERIYDAYSPGLYRYALRKLADPVTAEDCVSETFSKLLMAFHQGKGPKRHLKAYLYRVAHNWITDQYRRQPLPAFPLEESLEGESGNDPPGLINQQEELQQLRTALNCLTEEQREVILLKYQDDWTNEEISLAMHRSIGAIKALQHRALDTLKRLIMKTGVI